MIFQKVGYKQNLLVVFWLQRNAKVAVEVNAFNFTDSDFPNSQNVSANTSCFQITVQ